MKTSQSKNLDLVEISQAILQLRTPKTAEVRALRRGFSKRLAKNDARQVIDLALGLLEQPGFLFRFVAYELICNHKPAMRRLGTKELERLGQGMDSWEAVDTFACYLSGPAWRENQVPDSVIHQWAQSTDRWWRRAALVSTVPLNKKARGGSGDAERTLVVCRMLVDDRDDMVVKALSWALRDLTRPDPTAVSGFMKENGSRLAPRVVREVGNKLRTGLKNPRR